MVEFFSPRMQWHSTQYVKYVVKVTARVHANAMCLFPPVQCASSSSGRVKNTKVFVRITLLQCASEFVMFLPFTFTSVITGEQKQTKMTTTTKKRRAKTGESSLHNASFIIGGHDDVNNCLSNDAQGILPSLFFSFFLSFFHFQIVPFVVWTNFLKAILTPFPTRPVTCQKNNFFFNSRSIGRLSIVSVHSFFLYSGCTFDQRWHNCTLKRSICSIFSFFRNSETMNII